MIDLQHGDCLELMKKIPDNSVDCVVTDPPYDVHAGKGGGAFGLLKDFRNKLFDGAKRWIEEADSLREVKTICELCDRKATCNALENKNRVMVRDTFTEDNNNIVIGDNLFHVYCQVHWHQKYNHDKKFWQILYEKVVTML